MKKKGLKMVSNEKRVGDLIHFARNVYSKLVTYTYQNSIVHQNGPNMTLLCSCSKTICVCHDKSYKTKGVMKIGSNISTVHNWLFEIKRVKGGIIGRQ